VSSVPRHGTEVDRSCGALLLTRSR
jgi:hypothetical protein